MKIILTTMIFLLTTQQSHAFIWLLASGWAGYEMSNSSKEDQIKAEQKRHTRKINEADELAVCLKTYKQLTGESLNFEGELSEKLGFCKGSLKTIKSKSKKE
ncbi:MAG: hypothetical protein WCJ58_00820 [bacterium]